MIRFVNIVFLLCLTANIADAQILEINRPLFTDEPFFNAKFISNNKVKSITGSRSSKKVRDIIRTKGLDFYYEFNKEGLLIKQIATFLAQGNKKDTNIITYHYSNNNRLDYVRKSDSYGYFSYHYRYDEINNVVNQTYCRDENMCDYKGDFYIRNQYVINTDSFSYERLSDTQLKKMYYNSYNKVYKEEFYYYNELGNLIEEYSKYIIGNKKSKITYEYDEKGRISNVVSIQNLNLNEKIKEVYIYDDLDNILEIKVYLNDKYKTSKQYLYDKKTMLLTAQLIQEVETEFVQIIQYQYTFYNGETTSLTLENH
ncbi:MAG: hypothetical protein KDD24_06185 [Flavobacteriales bacterium]|nr:hypothetical protein [Flavobacteriales bacterium]MCB9173075.1 hypothetical protein [Flavobacteriales bacterium]